MKKIIVNVFSVLTALLVFTACNKDDSNNEMPKSQVMVVHASPNAPNVDVRINNSVALTNVAYPNTLIQFR